MDKLLDKEMHQLYKAPPLAAYLASAAAAAAAAANNPNTTGGGARGANNPVTQGFYAWAAVAAASSSSSTPAASQSPSLAFSSTPPTSSPPAAVAAAPLDLPLAAANASHLFHRKTPSSGCESDDSMSLRGDTPRSSSSTLIGQGALACGQEMAITGPPPTTGLHFFVLFMFSFLQSFKYWHQTNV